MKTIIAIKGTGSQGKSSTCRNLKELFKRMKIKIIFEQSHGGWDFRFIGKLSNKTIAIESNGDPSSHSKKRFNEVINNYKPDIFICTCRTSGEAADAVWSCGNTFDVIWTAPYSTDKKNQQQLLNELLANHIYQLLVRLNRL